MTSSRASLIVRDGAVTKAFATSPQRWNRATHGADGYTEVIHQVVGDGLFGGDVHRTVVDVLGGSKVVVRGITATPVRQGARGAIVTRLRVAAGATLLYLPGALLPQEGSDSTHSTHAAVEPGGALLLASVVLPGRVARCEFGRFERLRLRTVVRRGGELTFAEDAEVRPQSWQLGGPAGFAGGGAAITVLAVGAFGPACKEWWDWIERDSGVVWGVSPLVGEGVVLRGIAATLGDAATFLEAVECRVRTAR